MSLVCVIFYKESKIQCRNEARTKKAIVEKNISIHIEGQRLLFFLLPSLCLFKNACMYNCIIRRRNERDGDEKQCVGMKKLKRKDFWNYLADLVNC